MEWYDTNGQIYYGGLLDNLVLHRPDSTRQYAMAQFFCESDAERCRQQFDGRWIDGVRVDARRYNASGGRKRPRALGSHAEGAPLALSISKAIDVMNHFVGCFGWSHEILELQPASLSRLMEEPPVACIRRRRGTRRACASGSAVVWRRWARAAAWAAGRRWDRRCSSRKSQPSRTRCSTHSARSPSCASPRARSPCERLAAAARQRHWRRIRVGRPWRLVPLAGRVA